MDFATATAISTGMVSFWVGVPLAFLVLMSIFRRLIVKD